MLDKDGKLISWNPSFDSRQTEPAGEKTCLNEFLVSSSEDLFDQLLSKRSDRTHAEQGESWNFAGEPRNDNFVCLFIPMPGQRVLLIAEPVALTSDLETVTAELQRMKRILAIKETELKAVIAQADEVSHTDALTFLPNRRQIIADLQREVIFSDRYGTPLSISMLDIDHFKKINDTYGHVAGDEVLRNLAGELREPYPPSRYDRTLWWRGISGRSAA